MTFGNMIWSITFSTIRSRKRKQHPSVTSTSISLTTTNTHYNHIFIHKISWNFYLFIYLIISDFPKSIAGEVDELKSVGLFLFLDCSSIFSFINLQYSNKPLGRSQYCSLLKETVACNRLCKQEVMGICDEFGSFNEMQLDSGV